MQLLGAWLDVFHAGLPALAGNRDDAQEGQLHREAYPLHGGQLSMDLKVVTYEENIPFWTKEPSETVLHLKSGWKWIHIVVGSVTGFEAQELDHT